MAHEQQNCDSRRDYLKLATGTMLVAGAGFIAWPLLAQMGPSADVPAPFEFDLSGLKPGDEHSFSLDGNQFVLRHRHEEEILQSQATQLASLPDQLARNENLSVDAKASDENRSFGKNGEYTLMEANCPHFGALTITGGDFAVTKGTAKQGGRICPVCASHFDTAGRFRKGIAGRNLRIPQFELIGTRTLRLGSGKFGLF